MVLVVVGPVKSWIFMAYSFLEHTSYIQLNVSIFWTRLLAGIDWIHRLGPLSSTYYSNYLSTGIIHHSRSRCSSLSIRWDRYHLVLLWGQVYSMIKSFQRLDVRSTEDNEASSRPIEATTSPVHWITSFRPVCSGWLHSTAVTPWIPTSGTSKTITRTALLGSKNSGAKRRITSDSHTSVASYINEYYW